MYAFGYTPKDAAPSNLTISGTYTVAAAATATADTSYSVNNAKRIYASERIRAPAIRATDAVVLLSDNNNEDSSVVVTKETVEKLNDGVVATPIGMSMWSGDITGIILSPSKYLDFGNATEVNEGKLPFVLSFPSTRMLSVSESGLYNITLNANLSFIDALSINGNCSMELSTRPGVSHMMCMPSGVPSDMHICSSASISSLVDLCTTSHLMFLMPLPPRRSIRGPSLSFLAFYKQTYNVIVVITIMLKHMFNTY